MQRRPEAIARSREVMTNGSRVKTRIDSTEENFQIWCNNIADFFGCSSEELFFGGLPGLCHDDCQYTSKCVRCIALCLLTRSMMMTCKMYRPGNNSSRSTSVAYGTRVRSTTPSTPIFCREV